MNHIENYSDARYLHNDKYMYVSMIILTLRTFLPIIMSFHVLVRYALLATQLLLLLCVSLNDFTFRKKLISTLPLFLIICTFYTWLRFSVYSAKPLDAIIAIIHFFIPLWCGIYYSNHNYKCRKIIKLILICIAVTGVTTIMGLVANSNAARDLSTGLQANASNYNSVNIASFGFCYSLVIIFYILLVDFRKHHIVQPGICMLFMLGIVITLIKMEFTLSICLLIVVFLLGWPKQLIGRTIVVTIVAAIFAFIVATPDVLIGLVDGLYGLLQSLQLDALAWKILSIKNYIILNSAYATAVTVRLEVYAKSLSGFIKHPLIGNAVFGQLNMAVGKHSELLDFISAFGVIGGYVILRIYTLYYRKTSNLQINYCLKSNEMLRIVFVLAVVLSTINQIFIAPEISYALFVVPVLMSNLWQQKSKSSETLSMDQPM